jgi:hypothetical protein
MSILKGILHHWNKTNSAYDTIHPETEVAQVTDWNQGIVNTLASTALSGLVNTLTSDSLLAKMIQKVLTATGVKYSIDTNGYVCLGRFFGGLIIQWGYEYNTQEGNITYPISSQTASITLATATSYSGSAVSVTTSDCTKDGFTFFMNHTSNFRWIALCW